MIPREEEEEEDGTSHPVVSLSNSEFRNNFKSSVFTDEKEVYKSVSIPAPLTSPAHARLPTLPTLKLVCPHRGCKSQALATLLSSSCLILNC